MWRCIDEHAGAHRPQIDLAALRCSARCQPADRDKLDTALDSIPSYRTKDPTPRYAERTAGGKYLLTVNHTFAVNGGNWVVLIDAEASTDEYKPAVQKTVN